jgi:integrase
MVATCLRAIAWVIWRFCTLISLRGWRGHTASPKVNGLPALLAQQGADNMQRPDLRVFAPSGPADSEQPTIRYLCQSYLAHAKTVGKYSPEALSEREYTLDIFCKSLGDRIPSQCCPGDLQEFIDAQTTWKSPHTRRSRCRQILAVFNWHRRKGRLERNPFEGAEEDYPEGDPREVTTDDVLRKVLRATDANFGRFLMAQRLQGMRPGSVRKLQWEHIDWENKLIVQRKESKTWKKRRRPLIIRICPKVYRLLLWLYARSPAKSGHVFLNLKGTPWTKEALDTKWARLRKKLRLPKTMTLQGLRHAWGASSAPKNPIQIVSKGLGHASSQITERYYAHLDEGADEAIRKATEDADPFKRPPKKGA